jgi:hypothetical protein
LQNNKLKNKKKPGAAGLPLVLGDLCYKNFTV